MISLVVAVSGFVSFAVSDVVLSFGQGDGIAVGETRRKQGEKPIARAGAKRRDGADPLIGAERLIFSRGLFSLDDEFFLDLNSIAPAASSVASVISPGSDFHPAISPDGTKIVFASQTGGYAGAGVHRSFEIYIMNADGTNRRRLTFDNFFDSNPSFSPDGTKIIYASDYSDPDFNGYGVFSMDLDGSNRTLVFNEDSVCGFNRPADKKRSANREAELGHIPGDI